MVGYRGVRAWAFVAHAAQQTRCEGPLFPLAWASAGTGLKLTDHLWCREYKILHSNMVGNMGNIVQSNMDIHRNMVGNNIHHRNTDVHSKHVYRLDDKPGVRADGRFHNSTVHSLIELVWSP